MPDSLNTLPGSLLTPLLPEAGSSPSPSGERLARLNADELHKQLFEHAGTGQVRLKMSDDEDYLFATAYGERVTEHAVSWWGTLSASPDIRAYLSVVARPGETTALAGYIHHGTRPLSLETLADGTVRIFIPATGAHLPPHPLCCSGNRPHDPAPAAVYRAVTSDYASLSATPATPSIIRLLALYPENTLTVVGGQTQFEAKMLLGASLATDAFARSRINARVEVVFQREDALDGMPGRQGVMESVGQALKVPLLTKRIEAALVTHNADLAVLVTGLSTDGIFGYTPVIPEPPTTEGLTLKSRIFGVALKFRIHPDHPDEMDLIGERNTLTHELGHALGAKHDRITQPDYSGLDPKYDYVRGYVPDDQSFTTVMGYPGKAWGATRLNVFSGPELSWQGRTLGIPVGQPYAADCASFLRLSTQILSRYKGGPGARTDTETLSLAVTPERAGILTLDVPGPYRKHAVVNVKATPRAGSFVFTGWELDGKTTGDGHPTLSVKMDRHHQLTARFDAGQARHTVSVSASDPQADRAVSVNLKPGADGKYADGMTLAITLQDPDPHYELNHTWALLGWEIDGHYAGSNPVLSLRVDGNHTVKARVGKRQHRVAWRTVPDNAREWLYVSGYADVTPVFPLLNPPKYAADGQPFRFVASGPFDHWRINGKESAAHIHELSLDCRSDTQVEAFFHDWDKALKLSVRTNFFEVFPEKKEFHPWVSWAKTARETNVSSLMAYCFDSGKDQTYWITPQTPVTVVAYSARRMTLNGRTVTPGDTVSFMMQKATDVYIDYST